jgi:predicted transposase/invertase (TIGR01784 family)
MQVEDQKNWVPRSLTYLSREFDQLKHGDDYTLVKPVYHVGFLNFTLFEDHPEFHATYRLQNIRDGYTYTDKFSLHVLELNHINLATDEDMYYKTDKWASLFKATTWEEIKMLAQENDYIMSAAKSMYSSVTDPRILKLCTRRQEEIDGYNHRLERLAEQEKQIAEQDRQIAEQEKQIATLTADNLALKQEIAEIKAMLSK